MMCVVFCYLKGMIVVFFVFVFVISDINLLVENVLLKMDVVVLMGKYSVIRNIFFMGILGNNVCEEVKVK